MSEYKPPVVPPQARVVKPTYDARGNAVWRTRMSPPDETFAMCLMVPDRVIPVIFVPGVMGSNLVEKNADPGEAIRWRLDDSLSAGRWASPDMDAAARRRYLRAHVVHVDTEGFVPTDMPIPAEELRRRGWGEVGALSYGEWLRWLETALNDYDDPQAGERVKLMKDALGAMAGEQALTYEEIRLSYRYRFPVHAFGYNWLASNADSARRLGQRIDEVIARYRGEGKKCEKVILVTHSMGGLVARHCSEVTKDATGRIFRDRIFGIVHGVMPATGAAAVYRRFKAGTEDTTAWYDLFGALTASALGNDAGEMTAVLSDAPGPLQLLPTPEYGNGWLRIRDGGQEISLPQAGDPYSEIYTVRGKWWSMCEDHLINPLNVERDSHRHKAQVDAHWANFARIIQEDVRRFHAELKDQYHRHTYAFFGSHADVRAYGTVTWTGNGGGWLRGDRASDVLGARALDPTEKGTTRTVSAPLLGEGWQRGELQTYRISEPDEPGDGTVPHRSGAAPQRKCHAFLQVKVGHEPAYKASQGADNLRACRFTLRSIVKIAQRVRHTSLMYDDLK